MREKLVNEKHFTRSMRRQMRLDGYFNGLLNKKNKVEEPKKINTPSDKTAEATKLMDKLFNSTRMDSKVLVEEEVKVEPVETVEVVNELITEETIPETIVEVTEPMVETDENEINPNPVAEETEVEVEEKPKKKRTSKKSKKQTAETEE
jgi:hypothetical protein